jgi:hypothetical protein
MFNKYKRQTAERNDFPTGICVKTESRYYYINGKTKKPIPNTRVLKTWDFPIIVKTTEHEVRSFVTSKPLGFRNGTLIRDISDSHIYLISKGLRRPVVSPDSLSLLGKKHSDAIWVSHKETLLHQLGEDF